MKLPAILPLLALTLTTLPSPATAEYPGESACGKKAPGTLDAIRAFCAKTDMVVPSDYANNGATRGKAYFKSNGLGPFGVTRAHISGNCGPRQWVPQYWCYVQFLDMCNKGDFQGHAKTRRYGNKGCQSWSLDSPPSGVYS
ncbi:hypothetical protein LTR50_005797 [Elasticomyces elasticus]|nr:hypothetical protein LTR50_005797 [Elasticomyces elasticus]